ncbi:acetyl-CoA acetyltransferase [Marinomonas sp. MED121]|uniref:3-oxoadipyl-CoA thiolase n=1 Tax=Marinomonas sp. MED121 TaxID=314277 RepID=UPI000068FA4A|nr:3-oxoadipyl-CoA thiolase [Marinomonas sp. MED121]EAQ64146.1 acetyl-CoA acetyltransferase [Marinomonas sp. MED121]
MKQLTNAYIIDAIRTPIGRYAGGLSSIRPDDLGALVLNALENRNPKLDFSLLDDVILGCANQAGEDNRDIARMSTLLAGFSTKVPGTTINRLCGSGMDAIGYAARALKSKETGLMIAGGVESMSRAPMVMAKAEQAFSRQAQIYDTTIGWRFINAALAEEYGTDSMPETAENLASKHQISRLDQDKFAFNSQQKTANAQKNGRFNREIVGVAIKHRKKEDTIFSIDEHPRLSSLEQLSQLKTPFKKEGSVTAGNASGVNDGSCALLLASDEALVAHQLKPRGKILGMATAGVEPKYMGIGPVPATQKVLTQLGLSLDDMDVIELNEAFASQALAVIRSLDLSDDDKRINPNGGAIALGHPLGMSGARLITTALNELELKAERGERSQYALCTMCIGVGQGIAMVIERV